jgi:hypothetical protein
MTLNDLLNLTQPSVLQELRKLFDSNTNPERYVLANTGNDLLPIKAIATQLRLWNKASIKFPQWHDKDIIFTEQSLEQSSGFSAATYKMQWLKGRVADICGGLGSDLLHNADAISYMVYCDTDAVLCALFERNSKVLGSKPDVIYNGDGIAYLQSCPENHFDLVYADPDRRSGSGRSISLADSSPNILEHLDLILSKGRSLLVKASPGLDPTQAKRDLPGLADYRVISVDGEVKEVLLFVERETKPQFSRTAVLIHDINVSEWSSNNSTAAVWDGSTPSVLCEPDPAIIRAGLVSDIANEFGLQHSSPGSVYLIGGTHPSDFPGRVRTIEQILPANFRTVKQWCSTQGITSANIARREFQEHPDVIRKALKLKDGGNTYLVFTRYMGENRCLVCSGT